MAIGQEAREWLRLYNRLAHPVPDSTFGAALAVATEFPHGIPMRIAEDMVEIFATIAIAQSEATRELDRRRRKKEGK